MQTSLCGFCDRAEIALPVEESRLLAGADGFASVDGLDVAEDAGDDRLYHHVNPEGCLGRRSSRAFYNSAVQSLAIGTESQGRQRLASLCLLQWHLCSLDAPTVAVVWAMMLERVSGAQPHAAVLLVLGLGTWIVYVLDRVLDGVDVHRGNLRPACIEQDLKERHHFHRTHRTLLLRTCCAAAVALVLLCRHLPSPLVAFYIGLGLPVVLYGLCVHRRLLGGRHPILPVLEKSKEAAVASLFTAALAAPAMLAAQPGRRWALLLPVLLLALLCWLNCLSISHAEAIDPLRCRRERRQVLWLAGGLILASAAACVWQMGWLLGWRADVRSSQASAAVLVSSLLLLMLLLRMRTAPFGARRLRLLADLVLLTPLLFLVSRW